MWLSSRGTWSRCWALLRFEKYSSRFSWRQPLDLPKLESECLATIGLLLMFSLLLVSSNNAFVCCFMCFKKILSSRLRRKWTCVGLFASCFSIISKKVVLIPTLFLFCACSGKMVIQKTKNSLSPIILKYLHNHNLYLLVKINNQIMH